MTVANPFAAWMDRLADGIASLIPGCSRLPTRHPVKVSLVMTLLALLAGWSATALVLLDDALQLSTWGGEYLFYFLPGAFLGWMVLLPLSLWRKRGIARPLLVIVLSIVANVIHVHLLSTYPTGELSLIPVWTGVLAGLAYSTAGLVAAGGQRWWLVLPVSCVCVLTHYGLVMSESLMSGAWLIPDELIALSFLGNFFATIFAAVGVGFGSVLWDWTPPAKFEPVEEQQTSASS